jgi:RND family efflux transporter MFP subunit
MNRFLLARCPLVPLSPCPLVIFGFLLLAGCDNQEANQSAAKPPRVFVSTPIVRQVTDYEDFTGYTAAVNTVDVRARVTGYLAKTFLGRDKGQLKEGDEVEKGKVLFVIDTRPYKAELEKAEANFAQAKAHLDRLNLDYQRAIALMPTKAISREDVDKIVGDRAEAVAAVGVAKALRDSARLNIEWTEVRAPLSGRISRRLVDPGSLVKADDTVLTNIVSQNPMYAYFDVDEHTLLRIRRLIRTGKMRSANATKVPVSMELIDEHDFPHKGIINFIDNQLDPGTGTLKLRGSFANPKDPADPNGPRLLTPGLFVRVRVAIGTPHRALLIAEQALGSDQGQKFVYVVGKKDVVEKRRVDVGAMHPVTFWQPDPESSLLYRPQLVTLREILPEPPGATWGGHKAGLDEGDRVIVNGLQRAREGGVVTPEEAHVADLGTEEDKGAR